MTTPPRRFPPPWTVEETRACFIVTDGNGQKLAYVYCEDEPGRRGVAKLLSYGEDDPRRPRASIHVHALRVHGCQCF
jgi:hypothetical protein